MDWADQKHVWALESASGERERGEVESTPEAVEAWMSRLLVRFPGRLAVCLEQSRGALVYMLTKYESVVLYPVHPATVSRFRSALYPSGAKDDPLDAELLLDLLVQHRDRLRRLEPDTVETRMLRILVEQRRGLVDEKTAQSNRLTQQLKLYFPQVLEWFCDVDSPVVGDFLERWPRLEAVQRARPETLRRFLHQHNCRGAERMEQRLEQMRQAVAATKDLAVIQTSVLAVGCLVKMLVLLREGITQVEQQIRQVTAAHPETTIFESMPGAGEVLVPRLIAAFGTQRERFSGANEVQTWTGIAPVQERSGQKCWVHFRWACPKFLRQTFHEWAGHSIAQSAWARAYYWQQRAKGKDHHAAVRALAFKWIRIAFRCWKSRTPYDEATYLQALRRRGSPLVAALEKA